MFKLFTSDAFQMKHRYRYARPASGVTVLAHLFGIIAIILLLVWLLHYREGIDLDSDNAYRVFNVHPFLMFFGFIFMAGQAMMAYKTVGAERQVKKLVHMFFHLVAMVLGIVGLHAAFKFHDQAGVTNLYSLHSWIGIGTFSLFCLQWLFGLVVFLFPGAPSETKARVHPWHISAGRALLFMAICAALTGLMEKVTYLRLQHHHEARVINFLGLAILLFGIFVDLSISLARYV
ncbi:probable transmembrane ascorbate ferrireductase 3 [Andrographis paniculata]|uniref:probable transmembrane ascorbate ferrireductase 3 n=1 Tax=Andrographis paniculata TaxID=175694 RepID=UPI0021E88163|nr:probable transmembrane ascorbate ferrireductase 3 [Andrographis paniculata]